MQDVSSSEKSLIIEAKTEGRTQPENVPESDAINSNANVESALPLLQACGYTSSATNLEETDTIDSIVGLELLGNEHRSNSQDGGRKILGRVCSLQRIGVLTIWMIVQEKKSFTRDPGKALWSKLKLERNQSISLSEHVDLPAREQIDYTFNLTAAKRRISAKREETKEVLRSKSSADTHSDRPNSAANVKNKSDTKNKMADKWESGMLCTDLKVCKYDNMDNYLVAKSGGEVLLVTRVSGSVKVNRFLVTSKCESISTVNP